LGRCPTRRGRGGLAGSPEREAGRGADLLEVSTRTQLADERDDGSQELGRRFERGGSIRERASRLEDEPEGNLVTYRKSFFLGFTREVGDRLSKYTKAAVSETTGAEVAIYDRKQAVDSEYGRLFPVTQSMSIRRGSSGLRSGTAAGKKADIGITKVGPQGRRAIGG